MKVKLGDLVQSQHVKFTNLVAGHKFDIVDAGKTPEGSKFKCAFCGVTGLYWVAIKREDGVKVKVGRTCLAKAGIKLTKEFEAKLGLPVKPKKKSKKLIKPKNTKKAEKEELVELDEDLLKMLDDI